MKSQEQACLLYIHVHSLLQLIRIQWTPDYPNPSGQPIAQVWWIIETVWINEMIKVMEIDNFPVVLTIAIELLKQETLFYTKKQQVHVAAG